MDISQLIFYTFAGIAVASSVLMITRRNPVYSVMYLVLTLFSVAAIFVLLDAHFLAALRCRVLGVPQLSERVVQRAQTLEIVDEPLATVLGGLVVDSKMYRFDRADFLAVAAEDAAELVDLVDRRISLAVFIFRGDQLDTVRRTDRRTEPAGHALGPPVFMHRHAVRTTHAGRQLVFLLGILLRHRDRRDHMPERQRHPLEGRSKVRCPGLGPLDFLYTYRHVYPRDRACCGRACFQAPPRTIRLLSSQNMISTNSTRLSPASDNK